MERDVPWLPEPPSTVLSAAHAVERPTRCTSAFAIVVEHGVPVELLVTIARTTIVFEKPNIDDALRAIAAVADNACQIAENDRRSVISYYGHTVHLDPNLPRHLGETINETHSRWLTEALEVLARFIGQVDAPAKDLTGYARPLLDKMSKTMADQIHYEMHGSARAVADKYLEIFDKRVDLALREFELGRVNGAPIEVNAGAPAQSSLPAGPDYVSAERLQGLREIKSSHFDLGKLVRLCEELNSNYSAGNYFSVAMLVRAIMDHVPPIFSAKTFEEVRASHGGRSFKEHMAHLDKSHRKMADDFLHGHVRRREVLPTNTSIHFAPALDALLGEVIAHLRV